MRAISTVAPGAMTRCLSSPAASTTMSAGLAGPSMTRSSLMAGKAAPSSAITPVRLPNSMVSGPASALASMMAARSEHWLETSVSQTPLPGLTSGRSFKVLTTNVAAADSGPSWASAGLGSAPATAAARTRPATKAARASSRTGRRRILGVAAVWASLVKTDRSHGKLMVTPRGLGNDWALRHCIQQRRFRQAIQGQTTIGNQICFVV